MMTHMDSMLTWLTTTTDGFDYVFRN